MGEQPTAKGDTGCAFATSKVELGATFRNLCSTIVVEVADPYKSIVTVTKDVDEDGLHMMDQQVMNRSTTTSEA